MKIHTSVEQSSLEWLCLRAGKVTASGFGNIVTPKFKLREGEMVHTYLATLIAEKWQGGPLPGFSSYATEQGSILEDSDAVPWFELEHNCEVQRVGFIESDDGACGCSPDGIISGDTGLEIKCPQAVNHVKYLLAGTLPDAYAAQVHFSMFVTGFKAWKFLIYKRNMPKLLLTVERDEEICEKIAEALFAFRTRFDAAWAVMCERNGGEPHRASVEPKPKTEIIELTYLA